MSETKILANLERLARKSGGDRYLAITAKGTQFSIYLPQEITRPKGTPIQTISITIKELK